MNKEALHFRMADKNIAELSAMDIGELYDWMLHVEERLTDRQRKIAPEILKEIRSRLKFLMDVGLDYLSLNRSSVSLSGGESQRIRLALNWSMSCISWTNPVSVCTNGTTAA